jgi:hypothetical protein
MVSLLRQIWAFVVIAIFGVWVETKDLWKFPDFGMTNGQILLSSIAISALFLNAWIAWQNNRLLREEKVTSSIGVYGALLDADNRIRNLDVELVPMLDKHPGREEAHIGHYRKSDRAHLKPKDFEKWSHEYNELKKAIKSVDVIEVTNPNRSASDAEKLIQKMMAQTLLLDTLAGSFELLWEPPASGSPEQVASKMLLQSDEDETIRKLKIDETNSNAKSS